MTALFMLYVIASAILVSFTITMLMIPLIKKFAFRNKFLDYPGGRKTHSKPVPLLGGLGIWLGISMSTLITFTVFGFSFKPIHITESTGYILHTNMLSGDVNMFQFLTLFAGCSIMAILGLLDDIVKNGLHYRTKLIAQCLVAGMVVISGIQFRFLPADWLNGLFTLFWIIGIINAFNLLDGLDGLAAGVTTISAVTLLIFSISHHQLFAAFILAAIIGSCVGFLRHNFSPARIFMGDSGSLCLGFFLSTVSILVMTAHAESAPFSSFLIPVTILSVPILDMISVSAIRLRKGRSLFVADRNHLHYRLVDLGISTKNTVRLIYLITAGFCIGALLMPYLDLIGCIMIVLQTIILYTIVLLLITASERKIKLSTIKSSATPSLTKLLSFQKEEMLN